MTGKYFFKFCAQLVWNLMIFSGLYVIIILFAVCNTTRAAYKLCLDQTALSPLHRVWTEPCLYRKITSFLKESIPLKLSLEMEIFYHFILPFCALLLHKGLNSLKGWIRQFIQILSHNTRDEQDSQNSPDLVQSWSQYILTFLSLSWHLWNFCVAGLNSI